VKNTMSDWYIYIVRCSDNSLYTGVTKDIDRRVAEHNTSDKLGARYTQSRRPVTLVYEEGAESRSQASKRELEIKRLTKKHKEGLIAKYIHSLNGTKMAVVHSSNKPLPKISN
jgi:putative endonuclease